MSFSPDGRTLAVGTGEENRSELHLVDVVARRARRVGSWPGSVTTDTLPKFSLAFGPGGRRLAVALANNDPFVGPPVMQRFLLLDGRTGRPVWRRRYPSRRGQLSVQLLFGRDGALITSAVRGETLVWNAETGRVTRRYAIGGRPELSPDGLSVALALNNFPAVRPSASVALLDLRSGRHRRLAVELP